MAEKFPRSRAAAARPSGHFAKRVADSGRFVTVESAGNAPFPVSSVLARARLKKAGGSLVVTVPAAARNLLHLHEGQELAISVEGSRVVMEPVPDSSPMRVRRPKYTLDQLLTGAADTPLTEDEQVWHDAPAAGRETW